MKGIILAAGLGTRLKPLTDAKPKCLVPWKGRPIIDHILDAMEKTGLRDIVVVDGAFKEVLRDHLQARPLRFYTNPRFAQTNMVASLFSAEAEMNDDLIISYADIIYTPALLKRLMESSADVAVVVDKDWKRLWALRMSDPLTDAETLKLDAQDFILELGKKPKGYQEIQGQYMGLIKFSRKMMDELKSFYHTLDTQALYDGKPFDSMYMTSFLQLIIDRLSPIQAVLVHGGWLEIDSLQDLHAYETLESVEVLAR